MNEQRPKSDFSDVDRANAPEEAMHTGRFFHAVTYFITAGRKPL